jgi:hypothetical protein
MSKLDDIVARLAIIQESVEVALVEVNELTNDRDLLSPYGQSLLDTLANDAHDSLVSTRYLRRVVIENGVPPREDSH